LVHQLKLSVEHENLNEEVVGRPVSTLSSEQQIHFLLEVEDDLVMKPHVWEESHRLDQRALGEDNRNFEI
jgi:hypothetical protein